MHPSAVISAQKIEVNRNRERWAKGREGKANILFCKILTQKFMAERDRGRERRKNKRDKGEGEEQRDGGRWGGKKER